MGEGLRQEEPPYRCAWGQHTRRRKAGPQSSGRQRMDGMTSEAPSFNGDHEQRAGQAAFSLPSFPEAPTL